MKSQQMIVAAGSDCSARVPRAMFSTFIAPSQARRPRYKGPNAGWRSVGFRFTTEIRGVLPPQTKRNS